MHFNFSAKRVNEDRLEKSFPGVNADRFKWSLECRIPGTTVVR